MAAWRVVLKPEFVDRLDSIFAELVKKAETASSRSVVDSVDRPRAAFRAFASMCLDLVNEKVSPAGRLKAFGHTTEFEPIYVLTVGDWQGAFLVDFENGVCTGVIVVRASIANRIRAWFGRPLP